MMNRRQFLCGSAASAAILTRAPNSLAATHEARRRSSSQGYSSCTMTTYGRPGEQQSSRQFADVVKHRRPYPPQLIYTHQDPDTYYEPWSGMRRFRKVERVFAEQICAEGNRNLFDYKIPVANKPDF
jgi:hypothetical protein